jgi:uncharacterized damage-inducible protein DinB
MQIPKPITSSHLPDYLARYISLVPFPQLLEGLEESRVAGLAFFNQIETTKWDYAYQDGKWTIKQVLAHMLDVERIFAYRALRFSRKDKTPLPGFDDDIYALHANAENRTAESLIAELDCVRKASIQLYTYMDGTMLTFKGVANKIEINAYDIGWVMIGHQLHHQQIIQERYL